MRTKENRRRIFAFANLSSLSVTFLLAGIWNARNHELPGVFANTSASMPRGLWWRSPMNPARDNADPLDVVLVNPPPQALELGAVQRGQVLLKFVIARAHQRVCMDKETAWLEHSTRGTIELGAIRSRTRSGKALAPAWEGCRELDSSELFVMGQHPDSYDSRYFGVVRTRDLRGRAHPLVLIESLDAPLSTSQLEEGGHE